MKSIRAFAVHFVLVVSLIGFQILAFGLSLATPIPFVFSSHGGAWLVRVEPGEGKVFSKKATAQVFRFNEKTKIFDKGSLFNLENRILPGEVLVSEDGTRFVAVNDWNDFDYENPVMIVYDEKGRILKKFWLEDFVPKDEVSAVRKKAGGVPQSWAEAVVLPIGSMEVRVIRDTVIRGPDKKRDNLAVDLKTFQIRKWDP